jgi:hypothetical protein
MGEMKDVYKILIVKLEGKRPFWKSEDRWEGDNIIMDLKRIGLECVDWASLAQDRNQWRALVNTVIDVRIP